MNDSSKIIDVIESNLDKVREQLDPGLFISALLAALIAAFVAQLLYRFFYERRGTGSQVHRAFPLLAVASTPVKEPEEVGFIMLVIAASISAATFNFAFIVYMYAAAIVGLLVMRGAAALRWLRRDGLAIVVLPKEEALAKFSAILDYLRAQTRSLSLETSSTHDGATTYQFVFSGLKCDAASLEAGLGKVAAISSLNLFLDRPGGIR